MPDTHHGIWAHHHRHASIIWDGNKDACLLTTYTVRLGTHQSPVYVVTSREQGAGQARERRHCRRIWNPGPGAPFGCNCSIWHTLQSKPKHGQRYKTYQLKKSVKRCMFHSKSVWTLPCFICHVYRPNKSVVFRWRRTQSWSVLIAHYCKSKEHMIRYTNINWVICITTTYLSQKLTSSFNILSANHVNASEKFG